MKQQTLSFISRICFLSFFCVALLSCGESSKDSVIEGPPRSTVPSFSATVPKQVRSSIVALLAAYERGDGTSAYALLSTDREEFRMVNAFAVVQIPIMEPQVSMSGAEHVKIEYEMPHPGDIIVAILQAGDDLDYLKERMASLRSAWDSVKKTEVWTIVRSGERVRFDYDGSGIIRMADMYGTDVHSYITDVEGRRFSEKPLPGGQLPFRVTAMMSYYFMSFGIETDNPEMGRMAKEIFAKIDPVLTQQTMEVGCPTYSLRVPSSWQNVLELTDHEVEGAIMYAVRRASGGVLFVGVSTLSDFSEVNLSNKTDEELLRESARIEKTRATKDGKVVKTGDSQVGGVNAKFFVILQKLPDKPKQKILRYVFVKNKVVYCMTFGCNESDFDSSYDEIMIIKDTFRFRRFSWGQLVRENNALKSKCVYKTTLLELRKLYEKSSINPVEICKISRLSKPLQEPFINWWNGWEKHSKIIVSPKSDFTALEKKEESFTKPFLNAIQQHATQNDIPFLIFIEDIREIRHWPLGNSYQIVPQIIKKNMNDDIFGLLLLAIDGANTMAPDARGRLYDIIGDTHDYRALPTLVKWAFGFMYERQTPDNRLVRAIHNIDPNQSVIRGYFEYCESFAQGDYIPSETRRARILKKELE